MMNQKQGILNDLMQGRKITPIDALEKHGCFRLASRIHDLRKEGWPIFKEMIQHPFEAQVQYAEYRLDPNKENWPTT
jgi:hypothetical protein